MIEDINERRPLERKLSVFLGYPVVHILMQGMQVWSLVGELRSLIPGGQKNQTIKQKPYCNKFNKPFKKERKLNALNQNLLR